MLNSLYGDLPQAKDEAGPQQGWSISAARPPPARKAPTALAPPPSVLRGRAAASVQPEPQKAQERLDSAQVLDEYDPARPNDYEQIRKDRERQRQQAQTEAERQERLRQQAEEMKSELKTEATTPYVSRDADEYAANLKVSGEEAYQRRAQLSGRPAGSGPGEDPGSNTGGGGAAFAQRMMEKMGWKEGSGLGRAQQGIIAPLVHQKTDSRSGVIINAGTASEARTRAGPLLPGTPSKVVLLRNMVGPGEVDDSLEDEIGVELSKYGTIERIVIFEVTEPGYPADLAVRIFVEFSRAEAATKAIVDLEGRFFGGRKLRAVFFDPQLLERSEVAPIPGELE